jgi:hypothetical protein
MVDLVGSQRLYTVTTIPAIIRVVDLAGSDAFGPGGSDQELPGQLNDISPLYYYAGICQSTGPIFRFPGISYNLTSFHCAINLGIKLAKAPKSCFYFVETAFGHASGLTALANHPCIYVPLSSVLLDVTEASGNRDR